MIIQNGQNRNLAICNARQVAMLRGGQWIIEPIVLSYAVKSQIYEDIVTTGHHSASLASEVWRAANLYCKSHAASHPDLTAQGKLLSAFVNADKDMYCSLPLALTPEAQSALPTRWCIGDGAPYADTGLRGNLDTEIDITMKYLRANSNGTLAVIGDNTTGTKSITLNLNTASVTRTSRFGNKNFEQGARYSANTVYRLTSNKTEMRVNGNLHGTFNCNTAFTTDDNIMIGRISRNKTGQYIDGKWCVKIASVNGHIFLPCKQNNLMELLDLETLTIATRVGTFTEQKTIPNS